MYISNCSTVVTIAVAGLFLTNTAAIRAGTWAVSQRIPLGRNIIRVLPDPQRSSVYAIDRDSSDILFIDPQTGSIQKTLYVGKDPTDFDIDATGNVLYVANKGPGTGIPGSWHIGVVSLTNQTLLSSYITPVEAVNVTAGSAGRLYYNAGYDLWNGGDAHALDTVTGDDLGSFGIVKTKMAITSDKRRLFGQYAYEGNLGAMGVFDVSSNRIAVVDSLVYGGGYGWGYDNYCLSGDDQFLAYGQILFNPLSLKNQIGVFPEPVYALNYNGTVAFGQTSIWNTVTFSVHGDATKLSDMPIVTTIMAYAKQANLLYAYSTNDASLYRIEEGTTHGIPFRWLKNYGWGTNDAVEAQGPDPNGHTILQEWTLDGNPTNTSPALQLKWGAGSQVTALNTSPARWYELQRADDLNAATWQPVSQLQGTGSNVVFDVTGDMSRSTKAFYRVKPRVY